MLTDRDLGGWETKDQESRMQKHNTGTISGAEGKLVAVDFGRVTEPGLLGRSRRT